MRSSGGRERPTNDAKGGSMLRLKHWFNRHWPLYRRCMHPWCFRGMTYQYRCGRHQDDP